MRASDPVDGTWRELWLTVTPLWALLAACRVAVHGLQSLSIPALAPFVASSAAQGLLLWPFTVLGCAVALATWRRRGLGSGILAAILASALLGITARPLYAAALLLGSSGSSAVSVTPLYDPNPWYAWLADALEYSLLFLSCLAATVGVFGIRTLAAERRLRQQIEVAAGHERLRTLRAQLNPHFLFNALNSIVGLSEAQPAAQTLMTRLSDLLRRTLRASESEVHALAEELAYMEEYLQIEHTRQPSRIEWRIRVDNGCGGAIVPSLILLPLVENAVTHGLRGGVARVAIEITARRIRNRLLVYVSNTCADRVPPRDPPRPGMGLPNVRARLEALFGRNAILLIPGMHPGHFEVQISLPLRETPVVPLLHEESSCAS